MCFCCFKLCQFSWKFFLQFLFVYKLHTEHILLCPPFTAHYNLRNTIYALMNHMLPSLPGQKKQSLAVTWLFYLPIYNWQYLLHTPLKLLFFTNPKAIPVLQYQNRWSRQECTGGTQKREAADRGILQNFIFVIGPCLTPACVLYHWFVAKQHRWQEILVSEFFL